MGLLETCLARKGSRDAARAPTQKNEVDDHVDKRVTERILIIRIVRNVNSRL
jgi:hypothetical protein